MKKIHILIVAVLLSLPAIFSCQLPSGRENAETSSSQHIALFYERARDTMFYDPLYVRNLLRHELDTCAVKDSFDWYRLYTLYAKTFLITSEFDTIPTLCNRIRRYCERAGDPTPSDCYLLAEMNNILGNRYSFVSANDSARKYTEEMIRYARTARHESLLIIGYGNLADIHLRTGRFAEASYCYHQALTVADSSQARPEEFIPLYTGLAQTYVGLRNFDQAEIYFKQAFTLFDRMNLSDKFIFYSNQGNMYYFREDYPNALESFRHAYDLVKTTPDFSYAQNLCQVNIGEIYMLTGKLDSAQAYLDKGYQYFKSIDNPTAIYHAETQMLELALLKGDLAGATRVMQKATNVTVLEASMLSIRKKYLRHYYEQTNDYKKAYQYLKEYMQLEDSVRSDREKMRVAEISLRYRQDTTLMKQTIFIQQQQSDMQTMKLSIFAWIAICVLILLVALFIYFYQKKQRAYLLMHHRQKIIELRMANIRNRVSPHFIFNTLSRLVSAYDRDDNRYTELCDLIKLLRLNLKLTEKLCITLSEEIDFVRTYLNIERHRFDSSLQIDIRIDETIDPDRIELPAMMIQIPVENAIKHGLRGQEGAKELSVSIVREKTNYIICIADNGCGFSRQAVGYGEESTGTGLKVITQTVQLLNAENRNAITVSIQNRTDERGLPSGCVVKYTIPENYSYSFREGN